MLCLYPHCLKPINNHAHYGMHLACFAQWFHVNENAEFLGLQNISTSSSSGQSFTSPNDSFFQGKFKKYSATLEGKNYILKMGQNQAPELPNVEYLCNQTAQICHVNVAPFYLITLNHEHVFVTKNFIQPELGDDLQHIYHFRANEMHTCEALINIIIDKTKNPVHVDTFIKTILFDALIMNHDRHGKNLAFIARQGAYYLSPIYDNVSCLSLQMGEWLKMDFDMRGKIATQATNTPNMSDYVIELIRLGYKEQVNDFYTHLKNIGRTQIIHRIDQSFCSILMKEAIKKVINKRFKELGNALSS